MKHSNNLDYYQSGVRGRDYRDKNDEEVPEIRLFTSTRIPLWGYVSL